MPGSSDNAQSDPAATPTGGRLSRRPGLHWLLAAVLVPALLATVLLVLRTGPTEDDLRQRSLAALEARGITGAQVRFSGRDATVVVPSGANADEARAVVAAVDGVRVAKAAATDSAGTESTDGTDGTEDAEAGSTPSVTPSAATSRTPSPVPIESPSPATSPPSSSPALSSPTPSVVAVAPFSITRTDTSLAIQAVVRDEAARDAVTADARLFLTEGATLADNLTVDPAAGIANPRALISLVRALSTATGEATVRYDGSKVILTGQVADQATKATAARSAAAAVPGAIVANQLRLPPSRRPPVSEACRTFEAQLTRWSAAHKIGFLSGTSLMTEPSRVSVVRVAALLRGCATSRVEIAGHTDNLGDPRTSQPLSERRAEAVRAELVRLGVPAGRLAARGYGESRPIASNATSAGRIANRRVEILVAR